MSAEIATIIRDQIGPANLKCLGAHDFFFLNETDKHLGGLTFKFRPCPKIRGGGTVTITLDFNDTYTVWIHNRNGREISKKSGYHCNQLGGPNGAIEAVTG